MTIKQQIETFYNEIQELRNQISEKLKQIDALYSSCNHAWTEPIFRVKKIQYGIDHYMGSYDAHEWERTCPNCGKIETTQKENTVNIPDFDNNIKLPFSFLFQ